MKNSESPEGKGPGLGAITASGAEAFEIFKKALHAPGIPSEPYSEAGSLVVKKGRNKDVIATYQKQIETIRRNFSRLL